MVPLRLRVVTLAPPMLGLATIIFPRSGLSSRRWQGLCTESLYYARGSFTVKVAACPPPSQCCGGGPWLSLIVCGVEL